MFIWSKSIEYIHWLCLVCIFIFIPLTIAATTVEPPTITSTDRYPNDPTTVSVVWDSPSTDVVDINLYYGSTFNRVSVTCRASKLLTILLEYCTKQPDSQFIFSYEVYFDHAMILSHQDNLIDTRVVPTGAASSKQYDIDGLDICTEYWVIARAATCAAEEFSDPFKVELGDVTNFMFSFELLSTTTCEDWIKIKYDENVAAMETTMMNTLDSTLCNFIRVGCFSGSAFTCDTEKQGTVYFR